MMPLMLTMFSYGTKNNWKHCEEQNDIDSINNKNESRIVIKKSASPFARTLAAL
jgi:hypothetical protein